VWIKDSKKEFWIWLGCYVAVVLIATAISARLGMAVTLAIADSGASIYVWVMFLGLSLHDATIAAGLVGAGAVIFMWYRLGRLWRLNAKKSREGRHWAHVFLYPALALLSAFPFCTLMGLIVGFWCRLNKWGILAVVFAGFLMRQYGMAKLFGILSLRAGFILCASLFAAGGIAELVRRKLPAASLPSPPSIEEFEAAD